MTERDRLAATLRWLCAIESYTGEEGPLCDAIEQRLAGVELAAPARRYRNSLVVPVSRGGGAHVALAGHLDVVRATHDGPVRIEGDRLYGPGASDMKSGLTLMLDLLEHDIALCRSLDMTLIFYAREEGPYLDNELGLVLEQDSDVQAVDVAVCLEPCDNQLGLGACGSIHAGVHFSGVTAHSARPWEGENAIHKAGWLLSELAERPAREVVIDGLGFRTVTSATLAEGGRARNIVPDELVINLNHRFAPDSTLEQAQAEVEELVSGRARIEWRDLSPAALPHARHPLVAALKRSGVKGVAPKQGWTDVARFALAGVPAVNFGPGINSQAHQRNEWTSLTMLAEGRKILARWLQGIAASEEGA